MQDKMKDFRSKVRKYIPIAKDAKEKNLNEADTRMRIRVLLSDVLGYDMLDEITQEHMVQGHYVDLTVKAPLWDKAANKFKQSIIFFIEAKSVETTLRDTHVYQAVNYAASGGVSLCLLTNGLDYRLYSLNWGKAKVESQLVLSFNLTADDIDDLIEKLYLLTKESFKKGIIDKYVAEKTSLHDNNLAQALLSPRVLSAVRLELKAMTGCNVKDDAVERCIARLIDPKLYETLKLNRQKQEKSSKTVAPKPEPNHDSETVVSFLSKQE